MKCASCSIGCVGIEASVPDGNPCRSASRTAARSSWIEYGKRKRSRRTLGLGPLRPYPLAGEPAQPAAERAIGETRTPTVLPSGRELFSIEFFG